MLTLHDMIELKMNCIKHNSCDQCIIKDKCIKMFNYMIKKDLNGHNEINKHSIEEFQKDKRWKDV